MFQNKSLVLKFFNYRLFVYFYKTSKRVIALDNMVGWWDTIGKYHSEPEL